MFQNRTERLMGLKFSDGRQIRLDINGDSNSLFVYKGTFTYFDALDLTSQQIRGTITVVD